MNTRCPEQMGQLVTHLRQDSATSRASSTAGHSTSPTLPLRRGESAARAPSPSFVSSKPSPRTTPSKSRLYLVTANAQPAPGTQLHAVDQAAIWGLGRVIGHQEFAEHWGGLIDIDDRRRPDCRPPRASASTFSTTGPKIRSRSAAETTFVPRLRPCTRPDETVPHQAHRRRDLCRHRRSRSARPRRRHLSGRTRCTAHHAAEPKRHPAAKPMADTDRRRPPLRDRHHHPRGRTPRCPDHHRQCRCRRR